LTRDNLIPAWRLQKQSRLNRVRTWATVLGIYGVLLGATYVACLAFGADDGQAVLEQMRHSTERFRKAGKEIHTLRASLTEASRQIAAAHSLAQNPDWSLLLAMVARELSDDVVLDRCSLAPVDTGADEKPSAAAPAGAARAEALGAGEVLYQRYLLDLSGFAQTQMGVSQFVLRLENSRLFESVRLIKTQKRQFMDSQAVSFRIECALSGTGDNRP
jgi:Tfp pilus assembly protein PilN